MQIVDAVVKGLVKLQRSDLVVDAWQVPKHQTMQSAHSNALHELFFVEKDWKKKR